MRGQATAAFSVEVLLRTLLDEFPELDVDRLRTAVERGVARAQSSNLDTEGYRDFMASCGLAPAAHAMQAAEIAAVALFLASDASSAITGTAIDAFGAANPLVQGKNTSKGETRPFQRSAIYT